MLFTKNEQLNVLGCETCKNSGYVKFRTCSKCKGMSMGQMNGEDFIYFGEPLTKYHITIRKARRILNGFRIIGAVIFWLGFWGLFFWPIYAKDRWDTIFTIDYWFNQIDTTKSFFWLGIIALSYLWYRIIKGNEPEPEMEYKNKDYEQTGPEINLEMQDIDWAGVKKISHKKKIDFSQFLTDDARQVLERAYMLALEQKSPEVTSMHIFHSLLSASNISGVFIRLGISIKKLQAKIAQTFEHAQGEEVVPVLSSNVSQLLFHAYKTSREFRDNHVRSTELLVATVNQSEPIQEILYDLDVDAQKLTNVVEWVRIREKLYEQYHKFRRAAAGVSKHGMDRAMTAVATPFLNNYSQDLTIAAKFGHLTTCVARDKEIDEIFRIVEAGRQNVILVGNHGVGKMAIIEGIVQRMIEGNIPKRLHDRRFVQISTSSLLAGTTVSGAQERLIKIMNEVSRAKNIILFINNLHDLTGMTDSQGEGLDMSEALAEHLGGGQFLMFATTLPDGYNKNIVNTEIGTLFTKVDVKEMDTNQAIQVLESKAGSVEYKHKVFFSYDAIEQSVVLASKFFYDQNLPESAIGLMSEVASFVHSSKGENHLVEANDVGKIVSDKTGVPVTSITENESEKLMRLEEEMHKRVVGQDLAVEMVASALRRARADIRSEKRPIANFLFLGPTGVGKTELAKTIANVYFGGEQRMIRIDMSEYQDKSGIYRLIGQPGQQGTGILTEAIRQNPFSLVLLDEMEKADPDVLNLFLQVFDDGRLTDSVGRVVDFTNAIIIATSNAGTSYVQDQMNQGVDIETIREHLIRGELKKYYRPEFLNRFDGIVLFKALTRDEIKTIAGLMLKRVAKDLEARGVELRVEDAALEALADVGFDPEFGARPMRRAIQDRVENYLAELILQGKLERRDVLILGEGCQIKVERN
ncbi:ATP-dependent Clp protease ATP-binding subunit [Candidatus Parcubacteria bacterium]|jgi:ATP-dependent Clp protease ATP-binding subunit ClpC|nr:ATP-dependent Clp protease ATP-binding subunit [Candidatus Parcubacteria bacterium]MBT3948558.1 ATP-dependent Clp protease ATP-binding subunit [Candidatus Parcubacteria bacterium]